MRDLFDVNGTRLNVPQTYTDYIVGPDMIRRPVKLTELGQLSRVQSFLIYNGHYFSIDDKGSITEQDANFSVVRTAAISVGHGNAFQLGSNGVGYASGWDDNKIYIVDLSTLTVTGTIALPTSGYTTGVVDEARKCVYILQRDSYPTTNEYYNFIVYDYDGEEIISTRKTDYAFGGCQACDYHDGRIIVMSGFGGRYGVENRLHVLDVVGNTLAGYHFQTVGTYEAEGVFIDRETHVLYMSFLNGSACRVYRITE